MKQNEVRIVEMRGRPCHGDDEVVARRRPDGLSSASPEPPADRVTSRMRRQSPVVRLFAVNGEGRVVKRSLSAVRRRRSRAGSTSRRPGTKGRQNCPRVMAFPASVWQFVLMTVFSLLAAHLVAAAVLNWSISTRRQRSPVRRFAQRRLVQRLARTRDEGERALPHTSEVL